MIAVDFRSGQFAATTWRLLYASELRFSCDWTVINLILMWLSCDHIYVYCDGAATVLKATAIELWLFWRLLRLNCDYFRGYCDWAAIIFEATAIELRLFWKLLRPMTVCLLWWYEGRFMVAPHCERAASMIQISNSTDNSKIVTASILRAAKKSK